MRVCLGIGEAFTLVKMATSSEFREIRPICPKSSLNAAFARLALGWHCIGGSGTQPEESFGTKP